MKLVLGIILFLSYALSSGFGLILLKMAVSNATLRVPDLFRIVLSECFIGGLSLYVIGFVLWLVILSRFPLNLAFPVAISLFFVVSTGGSVWMLGETFTPAGAIGMALCFAGILLISLGSPH